MSNLNKLLKFKIRNGKRPFCSAVIAAGGSSNRMGGENKLFSNIAGMPVLAMTLKAFQDNQGIDEIIISAREEDFLKIASICTEYGITKLGRLVKGGKERINSVYAGVYAADKSADLIAVHDGARPLVSQEIINKTIAEATKHFAAAPAVPLKDTVKEVEDNTVKSTLDRSKLYAVQTPQIFAADLLKAALSNAIEKNIYVTDDCMAVEAIGFPVKITEGEYGNIKITTQEDIAVAQITCSSKGDIK